ncbi:MAG TPA: hypothetical protein ENK31_10550 [Nannocystis exedens]|nr:hypothetical protein [Nannocystis exedens]
MKLGAFTGAAGLFCRPPECPIIVGWRSREPLSGRLPTSGVGMPAQPSDPSAPPVGTFHASDSAAGDGLARRVGRSELADGTRLDSQRPSNIFLANNRP